MARIAFGRDGMLYVTTGRQRGAGRQHPGRQGAAPQGRRHGAAGQPVRRQGRLQARGLHARPSQLARPGRAPRHRPDVAERERSERRRRDQHPEAGRQLRLADRELRPHRIRGRGSRTIGPAMRASSRRSCSGFRRLPCRGWTFYTGDKLPKWKGDVFVGALRTGEMPGTGHLERILFNEKMEELRRESLLVELRQRIRDVKQGPGRPALRRDGSERRAPFCASSRRIRSLVPGSGSWSTADQGRGRPRPGRTKPKDQD